MLMVAFHIILATGTPSKREGDLTLLQKLQVVLQKQCDALISLGYEKSVKVCLSML